MAMSGEAKGISVYCGLCPDEQCGAKLFFQAAASAVPCSRCGKQHAKQALRSIELVVDEDVKLHNLVMNHLLASSLPPKTADLVKMSGLSNFHCKLVSSLLTHHGMDRQGLARPLTELGKACSGGSKENAEFDCASLADRAFQIEEELVDVTGYGRDQGSAKYLRDTLRAVDVYNGRDDCLVPIHADGDGHCLVHALSRALVGRELFWHALRESLKRQLTTNLDRYEALLCSFVEASEWPQIISECDPEYLPEEDMPHGLRNIHIFGLANVLRRPIVLLDCLAGLQNRADYSCVFLPALCRPDECRNKNGVLNKPLCIGWSSSGRNHYIALVGVKGKPLPRLPSWMIERAWATNEADIGSYVDIDAQGACEVGGGSGLRREYIEKLVAAMDVLFYKAHSVKPSLVCDVAEYVCKPSCLSIQLGDVLQKTQELVDGKRLYSCLTCKALTAAPVYEDDSESLARRFLHDRNVINDGDSHFVDEGGSGSSGLGRRQLFGAESNSALQHWLPVCSFCHGHDLRIVRGNGAIEFKNGDRTPNQAAKTKCQCGFKHFWDGKEYDNLPLRFPLRIEWNGEVRMENITWFQDESDASLNSNVYEVARKVVDKHFPGKFGIERQYQQVADMILQRTERGAGASVATSSHLLPLLAASFEPMEVSEVRRDEQSEAAVATRKVNGVMADRNADSCRAEEVTVAAPAPHLDLRHVKASPTSSSGAALSLHGMSRQSPPLQPTSVGLGAVAERIPEQGLLVSVDSGRVTQARAVRVVAPGKQFLLTLASDETYEMLLDKIARGLEVDQGRISRVKYGFPPLDLFVSLGSCDEARMAQLVPLKHGDRLTVELLSEASSTQKTVLAVRGAIDMASSRNASRAASSRKAEADAMSAFMEALSQTDLESKDDLDLTIIALALQARLEDKDLWTFCRTKPELFYARGYFYESARIEGLLVDGKHFTLPRLDGLTFCYNGAHDRVDLCLEPLGGHQAIESMDDRDDDSCRGVARGGVRSIHEGSRQATVLSAFGGRGYTLSSPLAMGSSRAARHPSARPRRQGDAPSQGLCATVQSAESDGIYTDQDVLQAVLARLGDNAEAGGASGAAAEKMCNETAAASDDSRELEAEASVRLGPGYSVIRRRDA